MARFPLFLSTLAGGCFLAGPVFAQIYAPYPTRPPPGYYRDYGPAPGGAYVDPLYDDDDEYIDPAPRERPRLAPPRRAGQPLARNDDYPDSYYRRSIPGEPLDLTPPRPPAAIAPGAARSSAGPGARYAALPRDADPAWSTPMDYDSDVDFSRTARRLVADPTGQTAGVITINTRTRKLYLSLGDGRAIEYGVGVGREGFAWKGEAAIGRKAFWPGWTPPPEMLQRRPDLPRHMEGGMDNPLGARALYLFKGNRDTMFRIHGTNEPDTIGRAVSSGCIRMMNADVIDLYQRVQKGAKVIVI